MIVVRLVCVGCLLCLVWFGLGLEFGFVVLLVISLMCLGVLCGFGFGGGVGFTLMFGGYFIVDLDLLCIALLLVLYVCGLLV